MRGDWAWTMHRRVFVPDIKIESDDSSYVLVPLRGYSSSLAVFSIDDRCIGWIDTRTLGHESVKAWIDAVNWQDGGY